LGMRDKAKEILTRRYLLESPGAERRLNKAAAPVPCASRGQKKDGGQKARRGGKGGPRGEGLPFNQERVTHSQTTQRGVKERHYQHSDWDTPGRDVNL